MAKLALDASVVRAVLSKIMIVVSIKAAKQSYDPRFAIGKYDRVIVLVVSAVRVPSDES